MFNIWTIVLGKTTLAYIIANELGSKVRTITGPSIEKLEICNCFIYVEQEMFIYR